MITRTGHVIPQSERLRLQRTHSSYQAIESVNGRTVTRCGHCGIHTPLYHESRLRIATTTRETHKGGFAPDHRWISWIDVRRVPVVKRMWVCERCYGSGIGEPIIPVTVHDYDVIREGHAERAGRRSERMTETSATLDRAWKRKRP